MKSVICRERFTIYLLPSSSSSQPTTIQYSWYGTSPWTYHRWHCWQYDDARHFNDAILTGVLESISSIPYSERNEKCTSLRSFFLLYCRLSLGFLKGISMVNLIMIWLTWPTIWRRCLTNFRGSISLEEFVASLMLVAGWGDQCASIRLIGFLFGEDAFS